MQSVFVNIFSVIFLAIAFILEVPRRPVHTYIGLQVRQDIGLRRLLALYDFVAVRMASPIV